MTTGISDPRCQHVDLHNGCLQRAEVHVTLTLSGACPIPVGVFCCGHAGYHVAAAHGIGATAEVAPVNDVTPTDPTLAECVQAAVDIAARRSFPLPGDPVADSAVAVQRRRAVGLARDLLAVACLHGVTETDLGAVMPVTHLAWTAIRTSDRRVRQE